MYREGGGVENKYIARIRGSFRERRNVFPLSSLIRRCLFIVISQRLKVASKEQKRHENLR